MPAPAPLTLVRLLLLALAAAALAAACAQLARAEGEPPPAGSVSIATSRGGVARTLALADLAAQDVHDAVYTLRTADGATSPLTVTAGISLETLLRAAGLEGDAFTYVELARPDGSSAFVLRDQLSGTDEGPPVVWSDEQGAHFLRPSSGDGDPNAADHVVQASGSLRVELRTGDPLVVRISASALRARPNEVIDFSASLAAGELSSGMAFQWYFDDDRFATGASVTHRFRRAGRYTVLLNIVRGGAAIGSPEVVVVRIEQPPRDDRPDGARRSDESQGGGGVGGSAGARGGDRAGSGTGAGAGGGLPDPAASAPAPAPLAPPPAPPEPAPARQPATAPEPPGELVSGTLLASASGGPVPAGDAQTAASARDGDAPADPLDVPVGLWVATGLGALLALGWTLESRHTLPFWQP